MTLTGIIFDIRRYSIHDGPGIRTTVFFKGCPLSCQWCHNPEGQSVKPELMYRSSRCIACDTCIQLCPQKSVTRKNGSITIDRSACDLCGICVENCYAEALQMAGRRYTVEQVLEQVQRDRAFYEESGGGVTFSGGEPLMQPVFLKAILQACKQKGISTAVDTSGSVPWKTIDNLRRDVDLFLYDLKLLDDRQHIQFTGMSNRRILENLSTLLKLGHKVLVRIPVIPGVNDSNGDIDRLARYLASLPDLPPVELLSYHNIALEKYRSLDKIYSLPGTLPPSTEKMDEIANIIKKQQLVLISDR